MSLIFFFKKKRKTLKDLFPKIKVKKNFKIENIRPLHKAGDGDISFFDSINYKEFAKNTKASACITNEKIEKFLPSNTQRIIVKNVLFELSKILIIIYPSSDVDSCDITLKNPKKNYLKKFFLVTMF